MKRPATLLLALAAALALLAGGASQRQALAQAGNGPHQDVKACSDSAGSRIARCFAHVRTDSDARNAQPARPGEAQSNIARASTVGNNGAYDPSYLQAAYNLASLAQSRGAGVTVAIVDAYDDPNAASNLASYRSYFGLATMHGLTSGDTCSVGSGPFPCFQKVDEHGGTSYPAGNSGWGEEISLDVDMVSAVCPNCNVLLVEANSAYIYDLGAGVNEAVSLGASAVSNSYGSAEYSGETSDEAAYYNHPGVAITVSSGDNGYGVQFPAASQYVTAVGGTSLNQTGTTGRNATETAWSGAGSGCSAMEPAPVWQQSMGMPGCSNRNVADVSAVADPNTGVWVYDTYGTGGSWLVFGGTSVASPLIGAMYGLAQDANAGYTDASFPYYNSSTGLNDITSGSNGSCGGSYLCTAKAGYDGPTGLGTPNTDSSFITATAPSPTPNFALSVSGSPQSVTPGGMASYTVSVSPQNGDSETVGLSVTSGLPSGATYSFSPSSSISGASGSATLSVTTASTTPTGAYTLTITGTGQTTGATHLISASLTVNAPPSADFSIAASPTSVSTARYNTTNPGVTITLTPQSGFNSTVTLSVSGLPGGSTARLSPGSVTLGGGNPATSTLTITAGSRTGTWNVTITARGGGKSHSTTVQLTVTSH